MGCASSVIDDRSTDKIQDESTEQIKDETTKKNLGKPATMILVNF
jgi:hypothetical protein